MKQVRTKQLEWLYERKKELESKPLQAGNLNNCGGTWVLRLWDNERGTFINKTIPRNEYPIYDRRIKSYRELKSINRAISQIEKALDAVVPRNSEVAA